MKDFGTRINAILDSEYVEANYLIDFGSGLRVTNAPQDITIARNLTYLTQRSQNMNIDAINPPGQSEQLSRRVFSISIIDDDSFTWQKYFDTDNFRNRTIDIKVVFKDDTGYTNAINNFRGNLASVGDIHDSNGRKIILQIINKLAQTDGEHSAITTDENQRSRDPTDASYSKVGELKELSWGKR